MSYTVKHYTIFFFLISLFSLTLNGQNYADKNYYLVDSLDFENLRKSDQKKIKLALLEFHRSQSENEKFETIFSILDSVNSKVARARYNKWLYLNTQKHIENINLDAPISNKNKKTIRYYANAINNLGIIAHENGLVMKATEYYYESSILREKINDNRKLLESYRNLSTTFNQLLNYKNAIEYEEKRLSLAKTMGATEIIIDALLNIGKNYKKINNNKAAKKCFKEAISYFENIIVKTTDRDTIKNTTNPDLLMKVGNIHIYLKELDKALNLHEQVYTLALKKKDTLNLIKTLTKKGNIYFRKKEYHKSIKVFKKALKFSEQSNNLSWDHVSLDNLAKTNYALNNLKLAKQQSIKSLSFTHRKTNPYRITRAAEIAQKIFKKTGNWKKVYELSQMNEKINDSLQNSAIKKKILQQKIQYDLNKKQHEIELLSAKNEIQELRLSKKRKYLVLISLALLLTLISALISFRAFKRKKIINKLLRKQKEAITQRNEAKKAMLQEIHHRVKNNLQVVNSLLRMQSTKTIDKDTIDMFKETQNRVRSMAKLHEKMYESGDFEKINSKEHLPTLINEIVKNYTVDTQINLELDIDTIFIDSKTMMPLSLIINEMITNSLKYAFEGKENGTITVKFHKENNVNELIIGDDGIGYTPKKTQQGLGSKLIESFTQQLKGNIEKSTQKGTFYKLTFS